MTGKARKTRKADAKFAVGASDGALSRENRSREFVANLVHEAITDAMLPSDIRGSGQGRTARRARHVRAAE